MVITSLRTVWEMRMMQGNKVLKKLLLCGCVFMSMILCISCGNKKSSYSCQNIPIGEGRLNWGMSTDEVVEVLGSPLTEETSEYGNVIRMTYEYDVPVNCGLGMCSGLVLYVGEKKDGIGGLATIELMIDDTTKEAVVGKIADFYGELSSRGGSTQMELDLKKANPNYFNETYWCDAWKAETLTEEAYNKMNDAYRSVADDEFPLLNGETLLMDVNISGIQSEDLYPCKVQLYANKMCLLENLGL